MDARRFFTQGLLALLLLNLAACSSYRDVRIESAMGTTAPPGVYEGSLVKVETFYGAKDSFRVTRFTEEGLGSSNVFYRYEDLRKLQVEKSDADSTQTWSVVLGIIGLAALVALVANADSVAVCSPSPCGPTPD